MMQAYVPIAIYRLPGDKFWTAEALCLASAITDGRTPTAAKKNLEWVLGNYFDMLDPNDPYQAIDLEFLNAFTAPPEGVDWIVVDLSPKAKAAREKYIVPVKPKQKKKAAKPRPTRRTPSQPRKTHARPAPLR